MKTLPLIYLCLILTMGTFVQAATKDQWKSRTIYQLLTDRFWRDDGSTAGCPNLSDYCGGTFNGIKSKLDYIQGMGFDAVWISPVIKNMPGGYHGYWASDLYTVNSFFGSSDDLISLSDELHRRGMYLMVDIVANHMGTPPNGDYSIFPQFPSQDFFHFPRCDVVQNDYSPPNLDHLDHCWLAGLPDLNQDNQNTRKILKDWIKWLVDTFKIDGLRIDTAIFVKSPFWREFSDAAGVYTIGEADNGDPNFVAQYQGPMDATLNYPMFFTLRDVFQSGKSAYGIKSRIQEEASLFSDVDALGVFVDNHDNARFLCGNTNHTGFRNALLYSIFSQGIPIVYYGDEQYFGGCNDPKNREQLWTNLNSDFEGYKWVSTAVNTRKNLQVWNSAQLERWVDDSVYVFIRGGAFVAMSNSYGSVENRSVGNSGFGEGQEVCNIFDGGDCVRVQGGKLNLEIRNGEPKVYVAQNQGGVEGVKDGSRLIKVKAYQQ
jgi:alpha-amylase